jgi:hypothetical protein
VTTWLHFVTWVVVTQLGNIWQEQGQHMQHAPVSWQSEVALNVQWTLLMLALCRTLLQLPAAVVTYSITSTAAPLACPAQQLALWCYSAAVMP